MTYQAVRAGGRPAMRSGIHRSGGACAAATAPLPIIHPTLS